MGGGASALAGPWVGLDNNKLRSSRETDLIFCVFKSNNFLSRLLRLSPPPSLPMPEPKCLPCPFMSKSESEGRVGRGGGTTGVPHPCQGLAATTAAALSVARAAATVFTTAFVGWTCDATLAHCVQHDMPRCHLLQKVHPLMVGRGVLRRVSLVFSPRRRRRRELGAGIAIGSPSLAAPRPCAI